MKPAAAHEPVDEGGNDRGRLTHNRQSLCVSVSVPPQNTPFPARNHPAFLSKSRAEDKDQGT